VSEWPSEIKIGDLVEIDWRDVHGVNGWDTLRTEYTVAQIQTVGRVVCRADDSITIAGSVDKNRELGCHVQTIPIESVTELRVLFCS
jgi:hypothetical protein